VTPSVSVVGRYALEFTELFDEIIPPEDQLLIDRLFPQVRLSLVSTGVLWDRRDNPIAPTDGFMVSADLESAMRRIGSEVGYIKTFFQGALFTSLGGNTRHVLATRAQLGLARGFPRPIGAPDNPPPPPVVLDPDTVVGATTSTFCGVRAEAPAGPAGFGLQATRPRHRGTAKTSDFTSDIWPRLGNADERFASMR
jgi:hypothetical protein